MHRALSRAALAARRALRGVLGNDACGGESRRVDCGQRTVRGIDADEYKIIVEPRTPEPGTAGLGGSSRGEFPCCGLEA